VIPLAAVLIAVVSDIHANLAALEAVLAHAAKAGAEAVWQLGDVVGYGPSPNEVISRLAAAGARGVCGNHDAAAVGSLTTDDFNAIAASAASWTAGVLTGESARYLESLPEVLSEAPVTLVHGTLRGPLWEYLITLEAAEAHFALQETPVSFVGHTHRPLALRAGPAGLEDVLDSSAGSLLDVSGARFCVNPGSVGQPRDGDPRAAYVLFDSGRGLVSFARVEYDIDATQRRIEEIGLHSFLANRLALGR
jgi:predicted phosphodiesterase